MSKSDHKAMREAAAIIANLLASTLGRDERRGTHLLSWELDGLLWLKEQWRRDPSMAVNGWSGSLARNLPEPPGPNPILLDSLLGDRG